MRTRGDSPRQGDQAAPRDGFFRGEMLHPWTGLGTAQWRDVIAVIAVTEACWLVGPTRQWRRGGLAHGARNAAPLGREYE